MKKIAVVLAGCGSRDGSEIHEAVCTLLSISQQGSHYTCFAPNREQIDVINHQNGTTMSQSRNLLVEAARIARGAIHDLQDLQANDFDALIIPGGFGIAKNFSDFPQKGEGFSVDAQLGSILHDFYQTQKWIGAICIAPVLLAGTFGGDKIKPKITTGQHNQSVNQIVQMAGCLVEELPSNQICIDRTNRIVTAPAYMNDASLADVYTGIQALVARVLLGDDNCE